jgi:carboxyl-terminal processing protease
MKRTFRIGLLLAVLAVAVAAAAVTELTRGAMYDQLPIFTEALNTIYEKYVDELPAEKLLDSAIAGALQGVDPESGFLTAHEYRDVQDGAATERADTGLEITRRADRVVVVAAREDSPAERAGLEPGDSVLKIDGLNTRDLQLWQVIDRMRGPAGGSITLTVMRKGWAEPRDLAVAREKRQGASVQVRDLDGGVAHIRVRWFEDGTAGQIRAALGKASGPKVGGLVLDLRDNAEGLLPPALDLLGLFLPRDQLVVTIDSRAPGGPRKFLTKGPESYRDVPMVVLVNEGSASAAEVVAGAFQDSGRGVILGTRTFGKSSSQSLIPLADGSAVWLTTARYVTPKGHAISGKGIAPDVLVDVPSKGSKGEDPQLERALQILKVAKIIGQYRNGT